MLSKSWTSRLMMFIPRYLYFSAAIPSEPAAFPGHNVNLTTVHARKETVRHIAFPFDCSAQRLRVLQAELELDEDAKAGMNNRTNLQLSCVTISCERSIYTQVCIYCCRYCPWILGRRWGGSQMLLVVH